MAQNFHMRYKIYSPRVIGESEKRNNTKKNDRGVMKNLSGRKASSQSAHRLEKELFFQYVRKR